MIPETKPSHVIFDASLINSRIASAKRTAANSGPAIARIFRLDNVGNRKKDDIGSAVRTGVACPDFQNDRCLVREFGRLAHARGCGVWLPEAGVKGPHIVDATSTPARGVFRAFESSNRGQNCKIETTSEESLFRPH